MPAIASAADETLALGDDWPALGAEFRTKNLTSFKRDGDGGLPAKPLASGSGGGPLALTGVEAPLPAAYMLRAFLRTDSGRARTCFKKSWRSRRVSALSREVECIMGKPMQPGDGAESYAKMLEMNIRAQREVKGEVGGCRRGAWHVVDQLAVTLRGGAAPNCNRIPAFLLRNAVQRFSNTRFNKTWVQKGLKTFHSRDLKIF